MYLVPAPKSQPPPWLSLCLCNSYDVLFTSPEPVLRQALRSLLRETNARCGGGGGGVGVGGTLVCTALLQCPSRPGEQGADSMCLHVCVACVCAVLWLWCGCGVCRAVCVVCVCACCVWRASHLPASCSPLSAGASLRWGTLRVCGCACRTTLPRLPRTCTIAEAVLNGPAPSPPPPPHTDKCGAHASPRHTTSVRGAPAAHAHAGHTIHPAAFFRATVGRPCWWEVVGGGWRPQVSPLVRVLCRYRYVNSGLWGGVVGPARSFLSSLMTSLTPAANDQVRMTAPLPPPLPLRVCPCCPLLSPLTPRGAACPSHLHHQEVISNLYIAAGNSSGPFVLDHHNKVGCVL